MMNSFCTATLTVCCRYENQCWMLLENCKHSWLLDKILNYFDTRLWTLYFLLYVGTHQSYHGNTRYDAKLHEHFITPQKHQTRRLHAKLQAQSRGKSLGGQTITSPLTCLSKLEKKNSWMWIRFLWYVKAWTPHYVLLSPSRFHDLLLKNWKEKTDLPSKR